MEFKMVSKKIIVFNDKKIRRVWHKEEWYFCIADVVEILTDSKDPKGYIKDMRRRDSYLSKAWGQIATLLSVDTSGGKQSVNCSNKKGIFRIIQSIPSKRAEPFKLWLAKVGSDRVEEIENPELAQARMKKLYELKGYSKDWIDKRLRGIAIRQNLTDEWKNREVGENVEYAILTNEISKATFGKTVEEYKKYKNLEKENLRDFMNDWELILTMIGEKATTEITQKDDSFGFNECKNSAQKGGKIAGNTRKNLEKSLGKSLLSKENPLDIKKISKKNKVKSKNKKKISRRLN